MPRSASRPLPLFEPEPAISQTPSAAEARPFSEVVADFSEFGQPSTQLREGSIPTWSTNSGPLASVRPIRFMR